MRRALLVSEIALATLAMSVPVVMAAEPAAATAQVKTEAVFNDPTGDETAQNALQDRIVELIEGAAEGSEIRMSMFYASDKTIPEALAAAHQRGVNVQVMFNASSKSDYGDVYKILSSEVGEDDSKDSFVSTCPSDRGCIGSLETWGVKALNHNKFLLFTDTLDTSNVVVQSSANLNDGRDGTKGWNAGMVLADHDEIYQSYDGYFDDQVTAQADQNYYDTRKPVSQDNAKIHYFPRAASGDPYPDPSEDPMSTVLDNVACKGNSEVGTPDDHTIIRVNQSIFSLPYLAKKLVDLDAAGCYVEVTTTVPEKNDLAREALQAMLAKTDSGYNGVGVSYYCAKDDAVWTHSKYMVLEGKYYDEADRKLTWTGSANWSTNSLRQSDETSLQFEDATVHDDFRANFHDAFDAATHQADNGDSIAC